MAFLVSFRIRASPDPARRNFEAMSRKPLEITLVEFPSSSMPATSDFLARELLPADRRFLTDPNNSGADSA